MSLRLKLLIAAAALGVSVFTVFGDPLFVAMGLQSGAGRILIAWALLSVGVIWFIWSSFAVRRTTRNVRNRSSKE